jgi:hypothetical protein
LYWYYLNKFSKIDNNIVKTSIDISVYMSKSRDKKINQLEYSWITGSQMYVMNCIRHDIAYLVSKLSRFISNPSIDHWKIKKKVFKYLRYTLYYELYYTSYIVVLGGYNDANWISNIKNSKSTSIHVFTLGGVTVLWKSSKQTCITRSMMK